jgi:hypothetical protein
MGRRGPAARLRGVPHERACVPDDPGFVRGPSVRDVEASPADALGPEEALSKCTVACVCEASQYDTLGGRHLSRVSLECLLLGRVAPSHARRGASSAGARRLRHHHRVTSGARRPRFGRQSSPPTQRRASWSPWSPGGCVRRCWCWSSPTAPPASIGTVELVFPNSLHRSCAIHCHRNILAKVPVEHHKRVRHSTFIGRTLGETRRRTKVVSRLPGERSCLGLLGACWAYSDAVRTGLCRACQGPSGRWSRSQPPPRLGKGGQGPLGAPAGPAGGSSDGAQVRAGRLGPSEVDHGAVAPLFFLLARLPLARVVLDFALLPVVALARAPRAFVAAITRVEVGVAVVGRVRR